VFCRWCKNCAQKRVKNGYFVGWGTFYKGKKHVFQIFGKMSVSVAVFRKAIQMPIIFFGRKKGVFLAENEKGPIFGPYKWPGFD
jgi:hypothetical protein